MKEVYGIRFEDELHATIYEDKHDAVMALWPCMMNFADGEIKEELRDLYEEELREDNTVPDFDTWVKDKIEDETLYEFGHVTVFDFVEKD